MLRPHSGPVCVRMRRASVSPRPCRRADTPHSSSPRPDRPCSRRPDNTGRVPHRACLPRARCRARWPPPDSCTGAICVSGYRIPDSGTVFPAGGRSRGLSGESWTSAGCMTNSRRPFWFLPCVRQTARGLCPLCGRSPVCPLPSCRAVSSSRRRPAGCTPPARRCGHTSGRGWDTALCEEKRCFRQTSCICRRPPAARTDGLCR